LSNELDKATRSQRLKAELRQRAGELGFSLFGVTAAVASPDYANLIDWIDRGYAGEMEYFRARQQAYEHPDGVLPGVKSIVALAYPYAAGPEPDSNRGDGRVARYAWRGDDYHDVIHPKLKQLCRLICGSVEGVQARGVVDTAPLMERDFAQLAGLGWRGKNTLLLNKHQGSYFFLACLLTDLELPPDQPHETSHCGTCTACLDACPTDAFPTAGVLNATRCISYLTIEHRGAIDKDLRAGLGSWVFGCDICQEVCPWNSKPSRAAAREIGPLQRLELTSLFALSADAFRHRFRNTPLWRTRRRGVLRNAAIALGNQQDPAAIPALIQGLNDTESVVRGAAAWALGRVGTAASQDALSQRLPGETDESVRAEILDALRSLSPR
jgi:epoxyqueuosine reductase